MGWLIEKFGARALHKGFADSLARLKRAAETAYKQKQIVNP
jgi:hypothetical protein